MLRRLIGNKNVHYFFMFLYAVVAISLPSNKPGLSLSIGLLAIATFILTPFDEFQKAFIRKRSLKWVLLLFAFQLISLIWSKDVNEGWKFIVLTLPFYTLFFSLAVHPVRSKRERNLLLNIFLCSVTVFAIINLIIYHLNQNKIDYDNRQLSQFISHIRFALMVVVAIVISFHFFLKQKKLFRWILLLNILFLLYYTYVSEVVNGYIAILTIMLTFFYYAVNLIIRNKRLKYIAIIGTTALFIILLVRGYLSLTTTPKFTIKTLTRLGNHYESDTNSIQFDNGHPIYINVCKSELRDAWDESGSKISIDSLAPNHWSFMNNLIRYMSSKGLSKDLDGFRKMTPKDIKNVEEGYVSIVELKSPLMRKWTETKDELMSINLNPNGYTMAQRFSYWKAGFNIFLRHPIIGVGVGDTKLAFQAYYHNENSPLTLENRRTSHEQFLAISVAFGVIGLTIFILMLINIVRESSKDLFSIIIIIILVVSFLSEDTLETLAGATLCAFFMGLFGSGLDRLEDHNRLQQQEGKKEN